MTIEIERSEQATPSQDERAWQLLATMLPVEDWSGALGGVEWPDQELARRAVGRVLGRRRTPHVLVTGEDGVGITRLVRQVAAAGARGATGFPAGTRFLWVDCSNVGPEDSRACLETLIAAGSGEVPTVVCLDGFDRLLLRPNGGTNKPLLRATAAKGQVRFVGILSRWAFEEHVAGDAAMLELFTRVDVDEPSEEVAYSIARHHLPRLE